MANPTTIYALTDGRRAINVTEAKTLTLADCGLVQNVIGDAVVVTLPATTAAASFIVRNGGVPKTSGTAGSGDNGSALVSVSPNSADKIQGNGFTAADDKDAQNTKATSRVGDEIALVGDATDGWLVSRVKGVWARQA